LNKDWEPQWRGEIAFHTDPWDLQNDQKTSVEPRFNRCVIFETTENSWHSVTPVNLPPAHRDKSRKSFTIYLYTPTRPDVETAPDHGTVYVQPGLPDRIREGHTLNADDMAEINDNLARRQEYLRQMYKREYKFSRVIDELKRQLEDRKASSYVPLLGKAKVVRVDSPLHHDGWMSSELSFTAQMRQATSQLAANIWLPDDFTGFVAITLRVGTTAETYNVGRGMSRLPLSVELDEGAHVSISLHADATRRASSSDEREVSVIVDSLELV
jgi:hypothetical protein